MDKNSYETYEFMPGNSGETDQFLVVQDDGTFLLNRQIQYVAQVQDVKEVLEDVQPCAVYGVSQQFYVDVDNSAELISVSDQFILPEADNNGLYTNSYLLQPSSSTTTEPMAEDVIVDQYKQQNAQDVDIDMVTYNSKQGNNFTEITLSDDQYQTLEQKGWILLETNEKIYVLNTLGLHDITANDKLIQKLRNELHNDTATEIDSGPVKPQGVSNDFANITPTVTNQPEEVEYVINNNEQCETIDNLRFSVNEADVGMSHNRLKKSLQNHVCTSSQQHPRKVDALVDKFDENSPHVTEQVAETADIPGQELLNVNKTIKAESMTQETYKDRTSIKIKTKHNFKDIPDKIFLGKTPNGKRLVAKVKKPNNVNNKEKNSKKPPDDYKIPIMTDQQFETITGLHEGEFISLIQESMRGGPVKYNPQDVASADIMVTQLLKVPNLRSALIGNNLLVTKASENKDEFGLSYNKSKVALVTGRVTTQDDSTGSFEYIPNLLNKIKMNSDKGNANKQQISPIKEHESQETFNIYHVHITESKCADHVVRVSVALNKRTLPLSLSFNMKKRYPSRVYACSACATLFKTEQELKHHQDEGPCMDSMESENMLTIDTDKLNANVNRYITLKTDRETFYVCNQCNAKFTKLGNCERHIKTHEIKSEPQNETSEKTDDTEEPVRKQYKCKMCPSMYFHPSSLSKHIITQHIRVKSNEIKTCH